MGRGLILVQKLINRGLLFPQDPKIPWAYPVLAPLSRCYPRYQGRLSTRYSPVRHSTQDRSPFRVRLACVKHAASVRSEPGSNSPVYTEYLIDLKIYFNCCGPTTCFVYYLVFKDQVAATDFAIYPSRQTLSTSFFQQRKINLLPPPRLTCKQDELYNKPLRPRQ